MGRRLRTLALASGGGRTILNLVDRIASGQLEGVDVNDVFVSNTHCAAIERCRSAGLNVHLPGDDPDVSLGEVCAQLQPDLVLLCGYLRYLDIPEALVHRVLNIHPSLLPAFGGEGMFGDRVHAAVIDGGAPHSGCTVHLVDDQYDRGPIVLQRQCDVQSDDSVDTLAARVFELECDAFPDAITLAAQGRLRLRDNAIDIAAPGETWPTPLFSPR